MYALIFILKIQMDLLNSNPVVNLSGDEFLPIEGKTFIQQVQEFFAAQGGKANSPFGTVLLDKKGIKNDLGHGIGRLKAASFAAVKDVLEKGVVINPMGQYHTNNKKNPTGMIAAPITIGGEKYVCVVEVIANRQVTRLYVHEVTLTKNLQGDVADSNAVPEDNSLVTQPQGEIAKVLRNYVNTKNNGENNTKTENRHMNKKQIRLTESDLKQIVKESVNKILLEYEDVYNNSGRVISIDLDELESATFQLQRAIDNLGKLKDNWPEDHVDTRIMTNSEREGMSYSDAKHIGRYKKALYAKVKEINNIIRLMQNKNNMVGAYDNDVDGINY